jgi:hypothetical protein
MKKATLIQTAILIPSGAVATALGAQLASHNVSTAAITSTVLAVLSTGLFLASRLAYVGRTVFYTCPAKGCEVAISARDTRPAELDRLRALATDHSKHGATR